MYFKKNINSLNNYNDKFNNNLIYHPIKLQLNKLIKTLIFSSLFVTNLLISSTLTDLDNKRIESYNNKINLIKNSNLNDIENIEAINIYVNHFKYKSDKENYGQNDYYAKPIEMIKKNAGDCEDFAILKYNILIKEFNINQKQLSFQYGEYGNSKIPHIVLVYKNNGKEYILDNNTNNLVNSLNYDKFKKVFEVNENSIIVGSKIMNLTNDSKYAKLTMLSLPMLSNNNLALNDEEYNIKRDL